MLASSLDQLAKDEAPYLRVQSKYSKNMIYIKQKRMFLKDNLLTNRETLGSGN